MTNEKVLKTLMIDCGDGSGEHYTYHTEIQDGELKSGTLEFGKENMTRRIMQYLKIAFVNQMFFDNIESQDQILTDYEEDVFHFVSKHGAAKLYERLNSADNAAEDFLPSRYKAIKEQDCEDCQKIKYNDSYLFNLAEEIMEGMGSHTGMIYIAPSYFESEEENLIWISSDAGKLSIFTGRELETVQQLPPLCINARTMELLLRGEICGMLCEIAEQIEVEIEEVLSASFQIKDESNDAKVIRRVLAGLLPEHFDHF